MFHKLAIAALCLSILVPQAAAQLLNDLGWTTVTNHRGARIDLPRNLFSVQSAQNSDKLTFATADGLGQMDLFSVDNSRGETPAGFARRAARSGEGLSYRRVTRSFVAASTVRDGRILYRRCNFSGRMIHCVDLRYPAQQKRAWDGPVTRISLSLAPR